jgi:hypothetical protein
VWISKESEKFTDFTGASQRIRDLLTWLFGNAKNLDKKPQHQNLKEVTSPDIIH